MESNQTDRPERPERLDQPDRPESLIERLTDAVLECALDACRGGAMVLAGETVEVVRRTVAEVEESVPVTWDEPVDVPARRWLMGVWVMAIHHARGVNGDLAAAMYRRGEGWVTPMIVAQGGRQGERRERKGRGERGIKDRWRHKDNPGVKRLLEWQEGERAREKARERDTEVYMGRDAGTVAQTASQPTRKTSGPPILAADATELMHEQLDYLAAHGVEGECQDVGCGDCRALREALECLWRPRQR